MEAVLRLSSPRDKQLARALKSSPAEEVGKRRRGEPRYRSSHRPEQRWGVGYRLVATTG
jgi:hypothetical protein